MMSARSGEDCTSLPNISKKTSSRIRASRQMSRYGKCRCGELPARLWFAAVSNVIGCSKNGGGQKGPDGCVINLFTRRTRNCWQLPVSNLHQSACTHTHKPTLAVTTCLTTWRIFADCSQWGLSLLQWQHLRQQNSWQPSSSKRADDNSQDAAEVWVSDRQKHAGITACWSVNTHSVSTLQVNVYFTTFNLF